MARPVVTPELRKVVVERDKECAYCHKPVAWIVNDKAPWVQRWKAYDAKGIQFQFDHKLPLNAGGANTADNIVLACAECNLAKARSRYTKVSDLWHAPKTRQLKVDDEVYNDLTQAKGPGETYSQLIARLLDIRLMILGLEPKLRGETAYQQFRAAAGKATKLTH